MKSDGCVYIVGGEGAPYFKIGATKNLVRRLATIQANSPIALELLAAHTCPEYRGLERQLHHLYRECRHHNEWFELSDDEIEFLRQDTADLLEQVRLRRLPEIRKLYRTPPLDTHIHIRCSEEDKKTVDDLADYLDIKKSDVIRLAIQFAHEHIETFKLWLALNEEARDEQGD